DLGAFGVLDPVNPDRCDRDVAAAQGGVDRHAISSSRIGLGRLISGFRPKLWPTVISGSIVLVCLGLGAWQLQRLHWKEGLIAARAAAISAPPIAPPQDADATHGMEFRHVTDEGVFLHDKEIFVGASAESGTIGYHVLTPLREAS